MLVSVLLTGCSWFESPANVKLIGTGYIQYEEGIYFVKIDSMKYVPSSIYTNRSNNRGAKGTMAPVDGMLVTLFTMKEETDVKFVAGNHSKEYLEEYFTSNYTFCILVFSVLFFLIVLTLRENGKS